MLPPATTPGGRVISEHALESLERHGFSSPYGEVDSIIDKCSRVARQDDGALVYIKSQRGRYSVAIVDENANLIVTALKDLTRKELLRLGRNNGFNPFP
jgi:filamentous hemagglutinin